MEARQVSDRANEDGGSGAGFEKLTKDTSQITSTTTPKDDERDQTIPRVLSHENLKKRGED